MIMARPAIQEVVFTSRVTEVAAPVQDFRAIKLDTAIKGTRATREVTAIREPAAATVDLSEQSEAVKQWAVSRLHH